MSSEIEVKIPEHKPGQHKRCIHNRRANSCKDCGGNQICEHKRFRGRCKDCNGSQICEHNRERPICKDCKGSQVCEHNRIRGRCTLCKGNSICEHNKLKSICVQCKGNGICQHSRIRSSCTLCKGNRICEHNRLKSVCVLCHGSQTCEHNKLKIVCKECHGSCICKHNRIKKNCIECPGNHICEHNRIKYKCRDCHGTAFCEHDRLKSRCKVCKGTGICQHNKRKEYCKQCGGKGLCKSAWCETSGNKKYNGYCLPCCVNICPEIKVVRNYKTKEKYVVDQIIEAFPNFTWVADKRVQDGCSKRRPDLLLDMGTHIVIVEIDENKHTNYDCSCENKRLMELSQDMQHRPIIFIRFNPDDYVNQEGVLVKSCWRLNQLGVMSIMKTKKEEWEERLKALNRQIQYWIDNKTEKTVEIVELFY